MAVGGGEEDELLVAVAFSLGLWEQVVPGDDDRAQVGSTSTWLTHTAGIGALEAIELGHAAGSVLLDQCESWRDLVDVQVRVEGREKQVSSQAYRSGGGIELVEETLVPGVDAILEDFLYSLEETIFATTLVWERNVEERNELLRRMVLDEDAARTLALLLKTVTFWLDCGIIVCSPNEGDDQIFHCSEKLSRLSVRNIDYSTTVLTSFSSSARCKPSSLDPAGLEGIEVPLVDMLSMF